MDWVSSKVAMGEYGSEEEANVNYLQGIAESTNSRLESMAKDLNTDMSYLDQMIQSLEEDYNNGEIEEGSSEHQRLESLKALKDNANNASSYIDNLRKIAQSGNTAALGAMVEQTDHQNAFRYLDAEVSQAVDVLQFRDYEVTVKADEFAKIRLQHQNELEMQKNEFGHDAYMENLRSANDQKLERLKKELGSGSYKEKEEKDFDAANDLKSKMEEANVSMNDRILKHFRKLSNNPNLSLEDWETQKKKDGGQGLVDEVRKAVQEDYKQSRLDANNAAVKAGKTPPFKAMMTLNEFNTEQVQRVTGKTSAELIQDGFYSYYDGASKETRAKMDKLPENERVKLAKQFLYTDGTVTISEFLESKL
jgi:hypothetical protein